MSLANEHDFDAASVEAMLMAAGDYVGPSDDLRPRVLEEARRLRGRNQQRWRSLLVGGSALAAALVISVQALTMSQSLSEATPSQRVAQLVAASDSTSKSAGGGFWALVDAFFKVRSEQADAFRPADNAAEESSEAAAQKPASDGSL